MSELFVAPAAPYLSIVCAFGHAQRTEAWARQTRAFLAVTAHQAKQHRLPIEIILVERDSAGDGAPAEALLGDLPANAFAQIRVISVPGAEIIRGKPIDRERRLQNIGIRRARGEFVLATGTDILLANELVALIAQRGLRENATYHVMRVETAPAQMERPSADPLTAELECRRGAVAAVVPPFRAMFDGVAASKSDWIWSETMRRAGAELDLEKMSGLLRLSFGNFLLMARRSWWTIGGFPEWNVGDFYLDRVVLAQARYRGWPTIIPPATCHYFAVASLRTPALDRDIYVDDDGDLRIKIEAPPIRNFNNWQTGKLLTLLEKSLPEPPAGPPIEIRVNAPEWGLAGFDLPEIRTAPHAPTDTFASEVHVHG